jgi:hypothetical protein
MASFQMICHTFLYRNRTRFRIHRPSVENSLVLIVASVKYNRGSETLPQSEYTLRAVSTPRMLVSIFVYCLFRVSTLSNERRDFISSRPIKLQKKVKILKFPNFTKFKNMVYSLHARCTHSEVELRKKRNSLSFI